MNNNQQPDVPQQPEHNAWQQPDAPVPGHNTTQRQQALTALADYIGSRNPAPEFVCYFNSDRNVPGDVHNWSIADEPSMATAWKNGQTVT